MVFTSQAEKARASVSVGTGGESKVGGFCWEVGNVTVADVCVSQCGKLQRKFGKKQDMDATQNTMILFCVSCTPPG
jgi:hypothetical protein